MYRRPFNLKRQAGKFCSRACRNRAHPHTGRRATSPAMMGAGNPAWKGGVTHFRTHGRYAGVRYVRAPEWAKPMARADGYVMEHRLVMASVCGRLLSRVEVVHHRDHDAAHNAPPNLELWPDNRTHKLAEHGRPVIGAANPWFPRVLALL
jgi:hypothetical protein